MHKATLSHGNLSFCFLGNPVQSHLLEVCRGQIKVLRAMGNVLRQQTLAVATGSETFKVQSEFKMAEHLDSLQRANLPSSL